MKAPGKATGEAGQPEPATTKQICPMAAHQRPALSEPKPGKTRMFTRAYCAARSESFQLEILFSPPVFLDLLEERPPRQRRPKQGKEEQHDAQNRASELRAISRATAATDQPAGFGHKIQTSAPAPREWMRAKNQRDGKSREGSRPKLDINRSCVRPTTGPAGMTRLVATKPRAAWLAASASFSVRKRFSYARIRTPGT